MQKIKAFFTNPWVMSFIGLVALSLMIWFIGPKFKFGEQNSAPLASEISRLIGIMILLMLWGFNNLWIQVRSKKTNNDLLSGLQQAPSAQYSDGYGDQTAEELFQLNERFTQALDTLKRYKFKGSNGQRVLYELPWYIIVGPPGSGKTTALVNSGLEFPLAETLGRGSLGGVGGTRNCDWWFTNEAVLIDTAGRYTTQDSHKVVDSSAWEGFLDLLRRNRKRRPINGAIVAISLQDLLMQTDEERALHAKTIRTRLDELMEKLQIRFPVYLMFTKSDLVSGFSEFFEDFSREERDQVWGISLPDAPKVDTAPDFDFFSKELTALTQNLFTRVIWRMHQERDVKRRAFIQDFPQQFDNVRSLAEQFVRQTFVFNRFKFQPYLRGVYFTSGTQDGTPIDRLMASVAANFGIPREVSAAPHQQGKSFFLNRLFREVIFPEAELVGANRRYEITSAWMRRGLYIGLFAIMGGIGSAWFGSVVRHQTYMSQVGHHIANYDEKVGQLGQDYRDIRALLPPLGDLIQASEVYDQQKHPWLKGLGLYDTRVDGKADAAYQASLIHDYLPRLAATLEREVASGESQGADLYELFRKYVMFKKIDHMDKPMLRDWFKAHWSEQYSADPGVAEQLLTHYDHLFEQEIPSIALNAELVETTRAKILQEPVAHRIYARLRNDPKYLHKVDILATMSNTVRTSYAITPDVQSTLMVPFMFTKEGYKAIDLSPDSDFIAKLANERWVLTDDENADLNVVEEKLDEVSHQVTDLYLNDYIRTWDNIYQSMRVDSFDNLQQGVEVLKGMTDPVYSSLVSILKVGQYHTQLRPPKEALEALAEKKGPKSKLGKAATEQLIGEYEGTPVDQHFRDLNALVATQNNGPVPAGAIVEKLMGLKAFVTTVATAPDIGQQSFEIASGRFSSGAGNANTDLKNYAQSLPEPVKTWLDSLAQQSWRLMMGAAQGYVNRQWRSRVYQPYSQSLQGRYPLNRTSNDEIALFEFAEFFKPGGTLELFVTEMLTPFVNKSDQYRPRVVDNTSFGISEEVLRQIRNAKVIRDIYFRETPDSITVSMELRPLAMESRDARFTLDVGEQHLVYNHGPKLWKPVKWQVAQENSQVRMMFEDINGSQHERAFAGTWAWFRLLDASYIEKTGQANVHTVVFSANEDQHTRPEDVHKISYEVKTNSAFSPLRREALSGFRLPESMF